MGRLIDGMTIVSAGHTYPDLAVGLAIIGIMFGAVFACAAVISYVEDSKAGFIFSIGGIILFAYMAYRGFTMPLIPTIKVILSEDVDMVELMQRYEVQSIDGKIWELVEKEQNDDTDTTDSDVSP